MTLPMDAAAEIRRLHFAEKWPVHTIVAQLHVHADAVRRVLGLATASSGTHPKPRVQDLVAPYTGFIAETLARFPRLRATRLFDMMQARGFAGSPRTVRRYLQRVRPKSRGEVCLRPQPLIGEQAQVDWMHVGNVSVGPSTKRALGAFVMVLSYSRALWAELLFDLTAHGVGRSLIRGCAHFGGSPRTWLFDNPKTVVIERHCDTFRFHPLVLEVASAFCADPRLCAVRHPESKGRVERAVRYLRDRFCAGRVFASLAQASAELTDFLERIAPARPHPEMQSQTVSDVFERERSYLLPLPSSMPPQEATVPGTVSAYGLVSFDGNRYSVPANAGRGPCVVAFDDANVRLLVNDDEVSLHRRCWGKRQVIECPEHRRALGKRRRLGEPNVAQQRMRRLVPDIDRLFARWVEAGRNVGSMTAQAAKVLDLYGDDVFSKAATIVLAGDHHDPGALALICEQVRKARNKPSPVQLDRPAHIDDRDVMQHRLEDYDV